MSAIKIRTMASIFSYLAHKHTFDIIMNIECMFDKAMSSYWQYGDCSNWDV